MEVIEEGECVFFGDSAHHGAPDIASMRARKRLQRAGGFLGLPCFTK